MGRPRYYGISQRKVPVRGIPSGNLPGHTGSSRSCIRAGKKADLTIVVGDPKSNNSNRLAQVSEEIAGTKAYRIGDISELKLEWLKDVNTVAVTAGASTPTPITKEVIRFLEQFDHNDESTWQLEHSVPLKKSFRK